MGIKLNIEIQSPLSPDDRDLLSGIAVMTLAIANRELAQQGFPDTFKDENDTRLPEEPKAEEYVAGQARPCGDTNEEGGICISPVGHKGRHKYRTLEEIRGIN
jgi:hypothetical protein